MNVLLAIPARGGSKRLPRKNLARLGGRPMLAHTIEAAIASELAAEVFVCTEDEEVAGVATRAGARVFAIAPEMADDEVSSTVPCLALHDALVDGGATFDYVFNLQASSPLRDAGDIRRALAAIVAEEADFLVSVTAIDPHYFHWAVVEGARGKREETQGWGMYFGTKYLVERPRLPPVYRPNGAIKLARAGRLRETGHFFGSPLAVVEMPEERSIHVATSFDLRCAHAMLEQRPV